VKFDSERQNNLIAIVSCSHDLDDRSVIGHDTAPAVSALVSNDAEQARHPGAWVVFVSGLEHGFSP
jgi:hypothetical protein